ncbi:hypothetical protein COU14_02005 [Candidatus Kaiserbacteria bacterium CG10_big_fil_rev_8_21_14_0_10_44_10]|uniref:DNA topoisomerase type IA zn finger domain-containing protein n=1 Tax=Candidatus Kaiserbacteria bacterium CG10_big_fil_rev_8_21_14_0_10_44_10 TaxID=1974606 RepID=A0A2H0UHK3_9BACT|nr:MAG: hypothetical protein COU14_02005 [Candidatus Kaiserbacteria bacterium CG10_big_fil_rev_8_21_14_0_10_44_10]
MEALVLIGIFVGISALIGLIGKINEYRERERSKQRDEIAVNIIAEYGLNDVDKSELDQKLEYVNKNLARRVVETEPYEIVTPAPPRRRQGMVCPKCEIGYLVRRQGKYGYFLGCSRYPLYNSTKSVSWTDKRAKIAQKDHFAKEFLEDLKKAYS